MSRVAECFRCGGSGQFQNDICFTCEGKKIIDEGRADYLINVYLPDAVDKYKVTAGLKGISQRQADYQIRKILETMKTAESIDAEKTRVKNGLDFIRAIEMRRSDEEKARAYVTWSDLDRLKLILEGNA
jgi:hypothetical protein